MEGIRRSLRKVSCKAPFNIRVDALDGAIMVVMLTSEGVSLFWNDEVGSETATKVLWAATATEFVKRVLEKVDDLVNGKLGDRETVDENEVRAQVDEQVDDDAFLEWARTGFDLFNV